MIVAPAPVEEDFWDKLFSYFPDLDGEYALYASGLFIPIVLYFFKRLIDFFFAYLRSKLIKVEAT